MKKYLKLMRVHHYIKNLLVFAALACSGQLTDGSKLAAGAAGFAAFCAVSSVVYILNDIRDKDKDRLHPVKCGRPIASGSVSVGNALILAGILLAMTAAWNGFVFKAESTALLAGYLIINIAYSFGLKDMPLVDVCILVAGFLIRIIYGAMVTDIRISSWLYLTVIAVSFYFALGKRRNELKKAGDGSTRKVLRFYPESFLDKNMYMCLALANVFYALWSMDEDTAAAYGNDSLVLTVPIVLVITMKYSMDIEGKSDGDPVEVLVHDRVLMLLCVLYIAAMLAILYFFGGGLKIG
jgi:4-hydroxybenzoate polyprenyltransferase